MSEIKSYVKQNKSMNSEIAKTTKKHRLILERYDPLKSSNIIQRGCDQRGGLGAAKNS